MEVMKICNDININIKYVKFILLKSYSLTVFYLILHICIYVNFILLNVVLRLSLDLM